MKEKKEVRDLFCFKEKSRKQGEIDEEKGQKEGDLDMDA